MVRHRALSESRWRRLVSELTAILAEEATAPDLFDRFLATLTRDFPASTAVLDYDSHETRTEFVTWRVDAAAMRAYSEHYHAINPYGTAILAHRLFNRTILGSRWIDQRALLRSEYYDGFLRPRGDRYFMAISIAFPDGGRTGVPFYRGEAEGGDFTPDDVRRLDMLRAPLQNSLLVRRLWRRHATSAVGARLDSRSLDLPVIDMRVPEAPQPCNDRAEHLLIENRFDEQSRRVPVGAASGGIEIVLPRVRIDPVAIFTRRYGLSPRESEVASLLCDGFTYAEAAARLSVSWHTINSHVKSILRKTGLRSIRTLPALLRKVEGLD